MPRKAATVATYAIRSDSEDEFSQDEQFDDSDFDFDFDDHAAPPAKKKTSKTSAATAKVTKAKTSKAKATAASKATSKLSKASTTKASKSKAKQSTITLEDDSDHDNDGEITNTTRPVLSEKSTNSDESMTTSSTNKSSQKRMSNSKKTVEERYQKLTQLEHILVRPDTYIGSVERSTQPMYILQNSEIIEKEITYTPGLYKIYDEILVNAADNKQRDPNMDKLDIEISPGKNTISVKNNGKGIPVEFHKKENCYVPTLVFGHLLTGSNFDDDEKKTTGGRNGYGAKLANIFSTQFIVECVCTKNGKKFKQIFRDNMKKSENPIIKDLTATEQKRGDFVKITFCPDLEKFKMTSLDQDIVALFSKRAYDIAGSMARCPGKTLTVTLNGEKVPVKKFEQYVKLYKGIEPPVAYEDNGDRWEIGVGISDGSFTQVSFVNGICTSKGGEHVNNIASIVAKKISEKLKKKKKDIKITDNQIKNYLSIFCNCLIENPSFDSQTKETLTTKKAKFGSKVTLSDKFLNKIERSSVVEKILNFAVFKERQQLEKKSGTKKKKMTGITKLDDANFAGSVKSKDCTLILTEGDSAKSLAMSGVSVVGRDYYGVFPLKGKPLNVRDASLTLVNKNEEIKNIIDILGLKFDVKYDENNVKTLRYGHLMIMADQDHDGSHIKGLIINFFHTYWPSLLDVPGFLQQFITPIVKATKGKQTKTFFTLPEYENWKQSTGNDAKGWKIKYYKGLGTSTSAEAKDYFSNLDLHEIDFCDLSSDECRIVPLDYDSSDVDAETSLVAEEVKSGADMIELAFSKKKIEERKGWLSNIKKDTYLNYSHAQSHGVKYSDFINKELILFSQADNARSIPHLYDGFKPSQRKVLFGCFLRNLTNEMKVAQLCGYIGEKSAYHHGEASLQGTIVNMAQDFTGSNNVNLLTPSGQFGTRRMGGKDSASPRYIFTKLEKITRAIFHKDDDALLKYLHEDGDSIEPEYYMPIIPMVLVNGADGIGTGWSTSIPNFDPRDLINNIKRKLNGHEIQKMHPHYFGFNGTIEADTSKPGSYIVSGKIERVDDETLHITELPIKSWTQDYKTFLEKMMLGDEKKDIESEITDFKENHTDTTVSFKITAKKEIIDAFEKDKDGLEGKFKLRSRINTTNMNVFDKHGRIVKFNSPEGMLDAFFNTRLDYYGLRKDYLLEDMRREERMLSNKARFVEEVCSGELVVSNRKRKEILTELKESGYEIFAKKANKMRPHHESESEEDDVEEHDNSSDAELAKGYEYLLGMKIWSLTFEKAERLRQELSDKTQAVAKLESTSIEQLWMNDLKDLEDALDDRDEAYAAAAAEEIKAQGKNNKRRAMKKTTANRKKNANYDSDEDFELPQKKKKATKTRITATTKTTKKPTKKQTIMKQSTLSKTIEIDLGLGEEKLSFSGSDDTEDKMSSSSNNVSSKSSTTNQGIGISKSSSFDSDSDSDMEYGSSLTDRFNKMKNPVSKSIKKAATSKAATNKVATSKAATSKAAIKKVSGKKRSSPKSSTQEELEFDDFDTGSYEPAALTPAPKRKKVSRKIGNKIPIEIDSDEDDIFDEVSKKSESPKSAAEASPLKPRSRPTRGRKKVTYVVDDSDDIFSDDEFDFDD